MSIALFTTAGFLFGLATMGIVWWWRAQEEQPDAYLVLTGPESRNIDVMGFDFPADQQENVVEVRGMAVKLDGDRSFTHRGRPAWHVDASHGACFDVQAAPADWPFTDEALEHLREHGFVLDPESNPNPGADADGRAPTPILRDGVLLNRMDGFDYMQARENQRVAEFYGAQAADLQDLVDQLPRIIMIVVGGLAVIVAMLAAGFGWVG